MEDTDKIIEREQGVAIREIFAQKGEETFREMETELLSRLAERTYYLGGGRYPGSGRKSSSFEKMRNGLLLSIKAGERL